MRFVEYKAHFVRLVAHTHRHGDLHWLKANVLQPVHGKKINIDVAWQALKTAPLAASKHEVLSLGGIKSVGKCSVLLRTSEHLDRNALDPAEHGLLTELFDT